MTRIKTFRLGLACLSLLVNSGVAMAENRLADIYAAINAAQADAFFTASSMEPPPSGEYILEGLTIDGSRDFTHVAGDGAGGAFVELSDKRIFLISSEGEAAGIAPDLETAIRISVSVNGLYDALRFIKENPAADKAAWLAWTVEWGQAPDPDNKAMLRDVGLEPMATPFEVLHQFVSENASVPVSNAHGAFVSFAR